MRRRDFFPCAALVLLAHLGCLISLISSRSFHSSLFIRRRGGGFDAAFGRHQAQPRHDIVADERLHPCRGTRSWNKQRPGHGERGELLCVDTVGLFARCYFLNAPRRRLPLRVILIHTTLTPPPSNPDTTGTRRGGAGGQDAAGRPGRELQHLRLQRADQGLPSGARLGVDATDLQLYGLSLYF